MLSISIYVCVSLLGMRPTTWPLSSARVNTAVKYIYTYTYSYWQIYQKSWVSPNSAGIFNPPPPLRKTNKKLSHQAAMEGIVCWPVDDSLVHLEASIRGPGATPYEEGVFKIEIHIPDRCG